jgi:flagellar protein FlaG
LPLKETSGRRLLKRSQTGIVPEEAVKDEKVRALLALFLNNRRLPDRRSGKMSFTLRFGDPRHGGQGLFQLSGGVPMGMQVMAVGNTVSRGNGVNVIAQELPQERAVRHAEIKAAVLENFESSLPGNRNPPGKNPVDIQAASADLEHISLAFNKKLKFVVDHQSNEITVKVIDSETDKVIKVLPPEELQRLHAKIKETIGFLFDERV